MSICVCEVSASPCLSLSPAFLIPLDLGRPVGCLIEVLHSLFPGESAETLWITGYRMKDIEAEVSACIGLQVLAGKSAPNGSKWLQMLHDSMTHRDTTKVLLLEPKHCLHSRL